MSYGIGLDIGITSVGFAVLELDGKDEPKRIIKIGSRIFDAAENPKDGSSLAKPRREARGARRRLRRHRHRLERIKNLIINENILTQSQLDNLYNGILSDVYELRAKALDEQLTNEEFARVLIHLAQRRGFKSNRKTDAVDQEAGKLLNAVKSNAELLESKGYRTIGEMLFKDSKYKNCKRNKIEDYSNTFGRDLVLEEVQKIFEKQCEFGMSFASCEIEDKYINILMSQRSFALGPGGDSPYGGNQKENMIGFCTLEKEKKEKRAPKACYSFEYFSLLQNVNNMRIFSNKDSRSLTEDERKAVIKLAHDVASLSYDRLRKELKLSDEESFGALSYGYKNKEEVEKKTKFEYLKSYHKIRKTLDKVSKGHMLSYDKDKLNKVGYALFIYPTDEEIIECLNNCGIPQEDIEALLTLSGFSGVGHLSIVACDKLIPFLEEGKRYDEACTLAGYEFKAHVSGEKQKYLPAVIEEFDNITNPVVRRAVSQTIKVVNAIIREQGTSPSFVNIELAREMSKSPDDRKKLEKGMKDNQAVNDRIKDRIEKEFNKSNPSGMDIVKLKLWEEQNGICPYSLQQIELNRLFETGYVDVDHIIPYSISFDDGYKNKVLVKSKENRQKGNRLPLQYLTGKKRDDFIVWVTNNTRDYRKRQLLLKEKLSDDDKGLKERNLIDTRYISKLMYNLINDYLVFAPSATNKKKRVTAVNGSVTSYVRKRWGIKKNREDGDLHHAVDAAVIACVTDGMIQKITRYSNYKEIEYMQHDEGSEVINPRTGEVLDKFPHPWKDFKEELDIRLCKNPSQLLKEVPLSNYNGINLEEIKPCFVSRMPKRKVTGAAHLATVKSARIVDEGYVVSKTPLNKLKLKDGEIKGYLQEAKTSDTRLYSALRQRLLDFDGDAEKAFLVSFYKPTKTGEQGPEVKKVLIAEKSNLNVRVYQDNGVAGNDSMIRVDVFFVENEGYYFVPIYVANTLEDQLPNRACVKSKANNNWKDMHDEDFIFSLYPNDLIKVVAQKDIKLSLINENSTLPKELTKNESMLYYKTLDINRCSIEAINHDKTYKTRSIGKTTKLIEKYQVDVLGNYYKVGKETRQYFK